MTCPTQNILRVLMLGLRRILRAGKVMPVLATQLLHPVVRRRIPVSVIQLLRPVVRRRIPVSVIQLLRPVVCRGARVVELAGPVVGLVGGLVVGLVVGLDVELVVELGEDRRRPAFQEF
jgi:hypothetical protein